MHESRGTNKSEKYSKHLEISPAFKISRKLNKIKWLNFLASKRGRNLKSISK